MRLENRATFCVMHSLICFESAELLSCNKNKMICLEMISNTMQTAEHDNITPFTCSSAHNVCRCDTSSNCQAGSSDLGGKVGIEILVTGLDPAASVER
jgi:hypothetical protein